MTDSFRPIARQVTVVVPTMGADFLEGCLESIGAGTVWPACPVVVDQSGTDAAAGWMARLEERGLNVLHVPAPSAGISAATNLGVAHADTTFAAVTHDDCRVRSDWLERLAGRLSQ